MVKKVTHRQKQALKAFYKAVDELKETKVIHSDRFLGDIAEFLCKTALGVELAKSLRQEGFDGMIDRDRIQIKYSGGLSNTVNCGDPTKYEFLFIVIGPRSALRRLDEEGEYLIYKLTSAEIIPLQKANGQFHCSKKALPPTPTLRL